MDTSGQTVARTTAAGREAGDRSGLKPLRVTADSFRAASSGQASGKGSHSDEHHAQSGREEGEGRHVEPAAGSRAGARARGQCGPRHHPVRRSGLGPLRSLPSPRRAPGRRQHRGSEPDLRRPPVGLPLRHRHQRVQQRRGAPQVQRVDRSRCRRRLGRRRADRRLGGGASPGVPTRRIPRCVPRPPRHGRGARQRLHPGAREERAREVRPPWAVGGDGCPETAAADLGRSPDPDRPARNQAAARRCARRHHRARSARGRCDRWS